MPQVDIETELEENCKPFLRWAGGKRWFKKHLSNYIPDGGYNNYHEPFLGGGAVFFHLEPEISFLSDVNSELIETYEEVQNNVEEVIKELKKFTNTEDCYYDTRAKSFRLPSRRAARFIYLNQTSFNGIYRVNLKGKYNVPFGYRKKDFFEPDNLRLVSRALENTQLNPDSFLDTIERVESRDLVFIDPPYTVTHNDNGFIKYNSKLFDLARQKELSEYIDEIKDRGAYYILTNAAHKTIREIFHKEGDLVEELSRASLIGGENAKRGEFEELVFTNTIRA